MNVWDVPVARSMFASAAFVALMSVAYGAEPETATTTRGQDVRLGYYSLFKNSDCSAGPAPEVRITKAPQSGAIVLRGGTVKTTRVPNCPEISGPVKQVIYRPNTGFSGSDTVSFEVISVGGRTDQHSVTINVQ